MKERLQRILEFRQKQLLAELERKRDRAHRWRGNLWTQEDVDFSKVAANYLYNKMHQPKEVP